MQEKKEEGLQQVLDKIYEVGLDEVGRGALFGPVFSASVILTEKNKLILKQSGVTDSKKLTPNKRKLLLLKILSLSSDYGIGQSSSREIDELGIRVATELSMIRALKKLNENEGVAFLNKKDEIEITDDINNARKKRRRSSATIE